MMVCRKLFVFLSCFAFFLVFPQLLSHAGEKSGVQTQTWEQELRSFNSKTLINMEFPKGKWEYCVIKVKGHWEKDLTHRPSQEFHIKVNGTDVLNTQLHGETTITHDLDKSKEQVIRITGQMETCNMANRARGTIVVTCYSEAPGTFHVTEVLYDTKHAETLNKTTVSADERTIDNSNSSVQADESITLSYTESKTITWEKTFAHTESVSVSAGYTPSSATGGGNFSATIGATFNTGYKNGQATTNTETRQYTTRVVVPPHQRHKIFITQEKIDIRIPYKLKGYVVQEDGSKKEKTIDDTCVFTNVHATTVTHSDLTDAKEKVLTTSPVPPSHDITL